MKRQIPVWIILAAAAFITAGRVRGQDAPPIGPRLMEHLGRGLVAVRQADAKVFLSWRLLGTDPHARRP